jgi:glucose-1-phosphate adenylyltransferase
MIKKELVMVRLEKNDPLMLARQLPLKTVALILAGGRGTRLKDLTIKRAKPAVHFGGKFRIIDFALSNCLNSGIRRIGVITQYQSHTLVQHIQRGWSFFSEEMNEFVDLLPAQQRVHGENWYRGTADAVTQNLDIIRRYSAEYIVILAGDHIYKQDYSHMLIDHVEKGRVAPWRVCLCPLLRRRRLASWMWKTTKLSTLLKNRRTRRPCRTTHQIARQYGDLCL